jgi:hypothetical protein
MDSNRWRLIEDLFHSARELPAGERAAFLARSCDGDAGVCDEVASLLREADDAGEFLSASTLSLGISLLAPRREAS